MHPIVSVDPAEKLLFSPSPAFRTMPDPSATKRPVKLTFKPAPEPSSHTHCPKPSSELKFVLPGTKPEPEEVLVDTTATPQPFLDPEILTKSF
ncbi:unnamed protein product [Clonostachys byssicola]|uniref:Uncharacterized protein n=1 Tax=Clonostachys byssicola TaxID=160290 RepID=A0A9N9UFI9_9HYPO|nr:unnamed protein product [Clonostachys byssicola]